MDPWAHQLAVLREQWGKAAIAPRLVGPHGTEVRSHIWSPSGESAQSYLPPSVCVVWQYRIHDLDPSADLGDLLERYAKAGWQAWAGRGADVVVNGVRVRRVSLRKDVERWARERRRTANGPVGGG